MRWRRYAKALSWIIPLTALVVAVAAMLASTLLPYQPYKLRSYVVRPQVVCAGGEVTAYVTRAYTQEFDKLKLEETWVTVDVPGYGRSRPVRSSEGVLPDEALHPTGGFETVTSPILRWAPREPGVYRVRIRTQAHGTRWWFIPAVGTSEFYSNTVRVTDCEGR